MSTATAPLPPPPEGIAGTAEIGETGGRAGGRAAAKTNWIWWLVGGAAIVGGLVLLSTLGGGDGAAKTVPVQLQPAAGGQATQVGGVAPIIPPPSPLEAQLGDIKNLDKFVQEKYNEVKNEADNQRAIALQTANLYQAQRLTEKAAAERGTR